MAEWHRHFENDTKSLQNMCVNYCAGLVRSRCETGVSFSRILGKLTICASKFELDPIRALFRPASISHRVEKSIFSQVNGRKI